MGFPRNRDVNDGAIEGVAPIQMNVRRGRRVRAGGLVVHGRRREAVDGTHPAGPRVAFVAPRTCGPAVRRNRTRRRVQEQLQAMVRGGTLDADVDLVVRLLPEATGASTPELGAWLAAALRKLGVHR